MRILGWSFLALAALCAGSTASAQPKPADAGPLTPVNEVAVEMPPYEVKTSRILPPPESWLHIWVPGGELTRGSKVVVAPGYEVLSNLSEKNTRLLIDEIQRRQIAGMILWPMLLQTMPRQPMVVIIDKNKQPTLSTDELSSLSWEDDPITTLDTVFDTFSSEDYTVSDQENENDPYAKSLATSAATPSTRYMATGQTQFTKEPPRKRFQLLPPGVVVVRSREGLLTAYICADQPRADAPRYTEERLASGLAQESARFALLNTANPAPAWFHTGLAWLVASTDVTPTRITFGAAVASFGDREMPPLSKVLSKTGGFNTTEEMLAAAFVHFGLYGNDGKYAQKMTTLVERVQKEPLNDQMFMDCFGMPLKKFEAELRGYVHGMASFKSREINGNLPEPPAIELREATQAEIARLKADALITQGEHAKALDTLRIAYWRGEREPAMLAVLASLEERIGSLDRARKITQALTSQPNPPARIFPVAARLRFRELTATRKPGEKLTPAESKSIMTFLGRAVQAGLYSEELSTFFSEVVLASEGRPHESVGAFIARAARRYPKNETISKAAAISARPPAPATTP